MRGGVGTERAAFMSHESIPTEPPGLTSHLNLGVAVAVVEEAATDAVAVVGAGFGSCLTSINKVASKPTRTTEPAIMQRKFDSLFDALL